MGKETVNERAGLLKKYIEIRELTEVICLPLEIEDYVIQPIVDVSPPKWHLGHTTWFFETLLLQRYSPTYRPYHSLFSFLFNSYYESLGTQVERSRRGHLSRPTVKETYIYRSSIDRQMHDVIEDIAEEHWSDFSGLVALGLQHEQQHQELLLTDIKFILAGNPLRPVYRRGADPTISVETADPLPSEIGYVTVPAGMYEIGFRGEGFCYDNEQPVHHVYVKDFLLRDCLVTNAEYLKFMADGGYRNFRYWLSDGWELVQKEGWGAPLYWLKIDGVWCEFTLSGLRPMVQEAPVCHVSCFEADAFAKWAGKRLPTEVEWEVAAYFSGAQATEGNFLDNAAHHPVPLGNQRTKNAQLSQMFGDVWEWTASAYLPYPGYRAAEGALGEYNGKFMMNQMVLRGGSCVTPRDHIRISYRNYFQPEKRWQFTGIRLADDT
ncbi:ergothioneine biosynthesis protein EgtB [Candidatus Methylomirabilis sp.]|uniref:ergothioneine biosynthesis protein EgtB n=1 Tax=Candidatus Methylomirabilis sp. TaxID=2032687 RepID=UPI003C795E31